MKVPVKSGCKCGLGWASGTALRNDVPEWLCLHVDFRSLKIVLEQLLEECLEMDLEELLENLWEEVLGNEFLEVVFWK